jgi:integrase
MTRRNPVRLWTNGAYWVAAWRDGNNALQRKIIGAKAEVTRRDALAICADMSPQAVQSDAKTLDDWRVKYLAQNEHLNEQTVTRYKAAMQWAERYFRKDAVLDKITPTQAIDFVAWLRKQRRGNVNTGDILSPSTVWGIVSFLRSWFEAARVQGVVTRNPFESVKNPMPKKAEDHPYVSVEDVEKVIAACPNASWRLVFGLTRYAGLRIMEAMTLELGHVDWEARTIAVWPREGVETTKQAKRTVPVSPRLYALLEEARDALPEGVAELCWEVPKGSYLRAATSIRKKAGVTWPGKPFHGLRASLETDWNGQHPHYAVCEWLGHRADVAARHYFQSGQFMAGVTGPVAGSNQHTIDTETKATSGI